MRKALAITLAAVLVWSSGLPASAMITLEEEREIAREALAEIMAQVPLVEDQEAVDYVRELGARLAAHLTNNPFEFQFWIIDDATLNAFALPAGYIFMFRGMMTSLQSEGELAGIMAHEISHVYHRHLANRMEKSQPLTIASIAGIIAGLALGALGAGALGPALTMGSIAGTAQAQLAFSREDEEQADFSGFKLMTAAGYPGLDMAGSFQLLARQEQLMGTSNFPNYLRTHPASTARMERMENMAHRYGGQNLPTYDNAKFLRVKTKLNAFYGNLESALSLYSRNLRNTPQDPLDLYGMSMVEIRRNRFNESMKILDRLSQVWINDPSVLKLQGYCWLRLGDYDKAKSIYQDLIKKYPNDKEVLAYLGQTYLQGNQPEAARQTLTQLLALDPDNPQTQYDLGMALGRLGQETEASAYIGLSFKTRGNIRGAMYHLSRAAQGLPPGSDLQKKCQLALDEIDQRKQTAEERQRREEERKQEEERRRRDEEMRKDKDYRPPRPWEIGR